MSRPMPLDQSTSMRYHLDGVPLATLYEVTKRDAQSQYWRNDPMHQKIGRRGGRREGDWKGEGLICRLAFPVTREFPITLQVRQPAMVGVE